MKSVFSKGLKLLFLVCFGLSLTGGPAQAQKEFTKTIKREFDISSDGTTRVLNKYGKVDVKTWNNNRVKIEVQIVVEAGSEQSAQTVFDRIGIDFSNTSNYVEARTAIEPLKRSWINRSSDKVDYSINYEVYLPPTNQVELETKYCDVNVAALQAGARINLKYGNLQMADVGKALDVVMDYGNGTIRKAANVNLEISHSNLTLGAAEDLAVNSKYTTLVIDRGGDIRSVTKYDTYKLGNVRSFRNAGQYDNLEIRSAEEVLVSSKYTNVFARTIGRSADVEIEYGDITLEELARGFSGANLLGKYSDFKVGVADGASFQLDAGTEYAGVSYPKNMTVTYEVEGMTAHEVKGHRGSSADAGVIKARLRYGALKVRGD